MQPNKVIFIDTETTGIDFVNDELIQVSAVTCDLDSQVVLSSINYYIESTKDIDPEAAKINGYYRGKWEAEQLYPIDPATVAPLIAKYLSEPNALIFAHNASFDRSFISAFLTKHGISPRQQPKYFFDTASIAVLFRMKSDWEKVSLDYIREKLHVTYQRLKKHDGLDDCYLLREVFFSMMKNVHVDRV